MKTAFLIATLLIFSTQAYGIAEVNKSRFGGLAIKGFDPVSYFESGKAAKGDKTFEYEYWGAKWRFVSQQNLELFEDNPGKYIPQYGGYCAWAVSQGYTANIDPNAWRIINEKLYLNYSISVQKKWEKNTQDNINQADTIWPDLLKK